jgi:putative protease
VRAAVENGADAIYFGLDRFNARMRAKNFTAADLPPLMEFLHLRGLKGYVTFNTLVFTPELPEAEEYIRTLISAGVDAAIVQDVGIARLIRRLSPDIPIHCSTQMTITSAAGVDFARQLGAQLVVLARENNLTDIAAIRSSQISNLKSEILLETFVHGALCVAYSGQCLTSEALGGRSANRGECAQACRLPYGLVSDGKEVELGDRKYLLSPKDLAAIELVPDLIRAGVASFKIEGRLKSAEYVASITRRYRAALDTAWATCSGTRQEASSVRSLLSDPAAYELQMAFSRGLSTGWFQGTDNRNLVHARFGTKRGVFLGNVTRVVRDSVFLRLLGPLKPGDGIVFDAGTPEAGEQGGRVYQVETHGGETALRFGQGDIDFQRVHPGNLVWKTNDPALDRELRGTYEGEKIRYTRPLHLEVHGHEGAALTVIARDEEGHIAQIASALPLSLAEKQPFDETRLRDQLGRLGGTPFHLGKLSSTLVGALILPLSELNRMRRDFVTELVRQRTRPHRWTMQSPGASGEGAENREIGKSRSRETGAVGRSPGSAIAGEGAANAEGPTSTVFRFSDFPISRFSDAAVLVALIRHLPQLEAAWAAGVRTIYCEFENPKHYSAVVRRFRELQGADYGAAGQTQEERSNGPTNTVSRFPDFPISRFSAPPSPLASRPPPDAGEASIWLAPPRIHKPGEEWILRQVLEAAPDGYLVRNYDHLAFFEGHRCRGDYSLNIANPLSAEYFLSEYNLERVTASYDLNAAQLEALLAAVPFGALDITLHQHMPLFHMEHCVFCAFLSSGKDYHDCGRPCDKHRVELRDRIGALLPLKADAGCRNTVFNNRAQTGAEFLQRFLAAGGRHFRIEFVDESPEEVRATLNRYGQLLRGEITGAELWREFRLINQLGVTRGQLEATANRG